MSRHEGVSCDSCLKGNFRGRRYKCLICYDYDLCSTCYEAGATTTRHTTDHPVQCILTRSDFDMYYGGEALTAEQPQSFTCPYCCKMGFTDATLHEHVTAEHTDVSLEVVCPICASIPGGEPNHVTDDFASHLALEHRTPRDFDEPPGLRHVRRIPHPGRGGGSRTRRANMHFGSSANTLTGLSPSGRENMDPIADVREWMPGYSIRELLSQLSNVRSRAAAAQSVSSQLQQLEMQLQSTRQQLERMPRRQAEASKAPNPSATTTTVCNPEAVLTTQAPTAMDSQYLLAKILDDGANNGITGNGELDQTERNMFVQELLLSTLTEQLELATHVDDPSFLLDSLRSPDFDARKRAVSLGAEASSSNSREGAAGGKAVATEVQCNSKGRLGGGVQPSSRSLSHPASNTRPGTAAISSLTQDAKNGTLSAHGSSVTQNSTAAYQSPSLRPALVPASPTQSSMQQPQPQQPQGSGVTVGHDHAVPLSRQAAASISARDGGRLNPAAAAKRSMLKHLPARGGATDTEPPPH
ncbi:E3 ubiquitin-protein ligase KCMF1-like isoform X3 [Pomacea canaliculata]|uniref:E3 ubiquitin-protein ligase KCMF1-like isoform X3 n=1 Tax=Pomacea canaliculata TaxID=400727 RepID=UPI000D72555D|nr:E3 ubiquitin-protein ligase KCMF1-like isoform X3 [Pomacea canaliculata]